MRNFQRQVECECTAFAGGGDNRDFSAHSFSQSLRDRQTESGSSERAVPLHVRLRERIEKETHCLGRHSHAGVLYGKIQELPSFHFDGRNLEGHRSI